MLGIEEAMHCPKCGLFVEEHRRSKTDAGSQTILGADDPGDLTLKPHCEILEMDAHINHMDAVIHQLRRQRATASLRRNAYTLIACLPVEIISDIFLFAFAASCPIEQPQDTPLATTLPLVLGRVCSHWRRIAWGLSELWSTFHCRISRKRSSALAALLKEWLARSGERLLTVRISMDDEDSWRDAVSPTEIIDALILHCHRWLHISLTIPESWYDRLAHVDGKVENLETLAIRPPGFIFVLKTVVAFFNAPLLQGISASHYYLHDLQFPWNQLQQVVLETASADEVLELMRRCPDLNSCRFEDLNDSEGTFLVDIVIHSKMQFLDVSFDPLSVGLPETHSSPLSSIEALIERSQCPLKTVQIKGPSLDEQDIINFLTHNDSINDVRNK
ncbi:hypothetical protein GALMADRAFT_739789 [Galerina marginata CBS 339.88]|uniref:F-box domain-containing protein n=1 Tax=Galerina marginata (strain CBS 339.88) TaxID=685588 RepID=A0A067SS71_GALM3|nr:hypothetical protein GALMADRAFT_739789 [Galerina marginata CBS 339.88]